METFTQGTEYDLGAGTHLTYNGVWEISDNDHTVYVTRGEMERLVELAEADWKARL